MFGGGYLIKFFTDKRNSKGSDKFLTTESNMRMTDGPVDRKDMEQDGQLRQTDRQTQ